MGAAGQACSCSGKALDAIKIIVNRSASMVKYVSKDRAAAGGLARLTQEVLQTSNAERGCKPNEAEEPLVQHSPHRCTTKH